MHIPNKGQVISVWGFIVRVLVDNLDLYNEWETFIELWNKDGSDATYEERNEAFVDALIESGEVEGILDEKEVPEQYETYFSWFFMNLTSSNNVPTSDDMASVEAVRVNRGVGDLSIRKREVLACGYMLNVFLNENFDKIDYFTWLGDDSTGSLVSKPDKLAFAWLEENQDRAIKEQGFAIQNVGGDPKDKWHMFSYTIGATAKLGYEVILLNAGSYSGQILANFVLTLIKGRELPTGVFEIEGLQLNSGETARAKCVELPPGTPGFNQLYANKGKYTRVVQLLIADQNNLLPGEPGYDETFVQHFTEETVNE